MLVTSNFKKNNAISIKLGTGEEVVARFHTSTRDELKVTKAKVLTLNPQTGAAMLIPWLMSTDAENNDVVTINNAQVVALAKPSEGLATSYINSTSSVKMQEKSTLLI
tara:strand:- start:305 stop:628 length:324 start_codon:yes stop_codon:yes gene_type:complete